MSTPESTGVWVALAEDDLLNIENNLASAQVPWSTVCFHAPQLAEKYLKAILITKGAPPPRIHDLSPLLELCGQEAMAAARRVRSAVRPLLGLPE